MQSSKTLPPAVVYRVSPVLRRSAPIVALTALVLLVSIPVIGHSYDDAFITFRYSRNLIQGHGFVYNPGDANLGTTAPLFGMVLAVLSLPNPEWLPVVAGLVSTISLLAISLGLYLYGVHHDRALAGWAAGLVVAIYPPVLETFGGEMLTVGALAVWSVIMYDRGRFGWAGFLVGIATLVRGDGGLLIVILGLHFLISRRHLPWRMGFGFALPLAVWMLYSIPTFGSFLPQTLDAKLAQGESGYWKSFGNGLIRWVRLYFGPVNQVFHEMTVYRLLPILLATGISWSVYQIVRRRIAVLVPWGLMLAWPFLHGIVYARILRVPDYHWYYVPIWLGMGILIGLGIEWLKDGLVARFSARFSPEFLTAFLLILSVFPVTVGTALRVYQGKLAAQIPHPYIQVGKWLVSHVDSNSTVGYLEIGYIGFYSNVRLIDPMGLVTPGAVESIRNQDFAYAYRQYLPDYILRSPELDGFFGPYAQEPWWDCYSLVANVEHLELYQRCDQMDPQDRLVLDTQVVHNDSITPPLADRKVISQTFTASSDNLRAVGLLVGTYGKTLSGEVTLHVREMGQQEDNRTVRMNAADLVDNRWRLFFFDPITGSQGKIYETWLEISGSSDPLVLWMQSGNPNPGGEAFEGGQPITGDFCMRIYYTRTD